MLCPLCITLKSYSSHQVKEAVGSVPIIANGDCWHAEDVWLCMRQTGADGFMSAQVRHFLLLALHDFYFLMTW